MRCRKLLYSNDLRNLWSRNVGGWDGCIM